jgi:hypothetical protein
MYHAVQDIKQDIFRSAVYISDTTKRYPRESLAIVSVLIGIVALVEIVSLCRDKKLKHTTAPEPEVKQDESCCDIDNCIHKAIKNSTYVCA